MTQIQVFVSFDTEHDRELYELILAQSRTPGSRFTVSGGSERPSAEDVWSETVRRRIREADQVIVICGEHTEASASVGAELRITREEDTPYFLVWGRRGVMCTKPFGAKPAEGMYSWTRQILEDQIAFNLRNAGTDVLAGALRSASRKA
jgi:hypothetical protein